MFPIHDDAERINGRPLVNYSLILINIIVFIYEVVVTGFFSNRIETLELFYNYGAIPSFVAQGDFVSVITSMFMHGGVSHIIGNMIFLYVFGDNIEDRFGHIKYIFIYLGWGFAAALLHSVFALATGGSNIPAVGASGAISGILGAYLIIFPKAKIFTIIIAFFITTIRIPAIAYIPFWFILQVILGFLEPFGGVAYLAHIGGFVAGVGTAFVWKIFRGNTFNLKPSYIGRNEKIKISKYTSPRQNTIDPVYEFIETKNSFEIIVEMKGVEDVSEVELDKSELEDKLRIFTTGDKKYSFEIYIPDKMKHKRIKDISLLNNILRIQIEK